MGKVKDTASFIAKAREIHGDRYDYSETVYINSRTPVTIICRQCGPFVLSDPSSHVRRFLCGCRSCNQSQALTRQRQGYCSSCSAYGVLCRGQCSKCRDTDSRPVCRVCDGLMLHGKAICNKCRAVRSEQSKALKSCEWFRWSGVALAAERKESRKIREAISDPWERWASTKTTILASRVKSTFTRGTGATESYFAICWDEWSAVAKTKRVYKEVSEWDRKCKNWARSLSVRERLQEKRNCCDC